MNASASKLSPDLTPNNHIKMVPNGGIAVLDEDGKMLAYKKAGFSLTASSASWDWVRRDFRG